MCVPSPHTPFIAASFNGSAAYLDSFVNLSTHSSAVKVMYREVLPMLNKTPLPLLIISQ